MDAQIKKDIFIAVITSGSLHQKENWKSLCDEAVDWVFKKDTLEIVPEKKTRKRKAETA